MDISLEKHICFKLYVSSRLIVQSFAEALSGQALTYPKYLVLTALVEKDGQTVSELGKGLFLDSGTLSPLLKSLETAKYILRRRAVSDDRVVANFLTDAGRAAQGKAMQGAAQVFCRTGMSELDSTNFAKVLDDFIVRCQGLLEFNESRSPRRRSTDSSNRVTSRQTADVDPTDLPTSPASPL